jgi:hypothetical protein
MAINVTFDIQTMDNDTNDDAWLDPYETQMMLDHTRAQIDAHIQKALGDMRCDVHGKAPRVTVNGCYDTEREELDISYDIQPCCKPFFLKCIAALNRV